VFIAGGCSSSSVAAASQLSVHTDMDVVRHADCFIAITIELGTAGQCEIRKEIGGINATKIKMFDTQVVSRTYINRDERFDKKEGENQILQLQNPKYRGMNSFRRIPCVPPIDSSRDK
jgi:hypothetical protein